MLVGIIGTGSAVLVAGVALLMAKFRHHLPGRSTDEWVLTGAIVLMLLAGLLATYIGIGRWAISVLRWAERLIGPAGSVALSLLGLAMLILVVIAVFRSASERVLWIAFGLPLVCAAINQGMFADLNAYLKPAADQVSAMLRARLGA